MLAINDNSTTLAPNHIYKLIKTYLISRGHGKPILVERVTTNKPMRLNHIRDPSA